ncbi:MAG: type II toxin-antitoxin system VapC family toxin [Pirellulales bacterium]
MESVYLETTFISYLVARPSRDLLVAAHQRITQDWWDHRRAAFRCVVSQTVIDESSRGNEAEVHKRLAIISGLLILEVSAEAESLTRSIMVSGVLPPHAFPDAAHVAISAVHALDYLLTWNCKHLANAQIGRKMAMVCQQLGYRMPIICTPEELMGA